MKKFRTAQGKVLDMSALIAKNEKVRAVGNMKVNARGDTIDANGRVIVPVTQKVGQGYAKTVGNRSAHIKKSVNKPTTSNTPKVELTNEEKDLDDSLQDDLEVEAIKAKESEK